LFNKPLPRKEKGLLGVRAIHTQTQTGRSIHNSPFIFPKQGKYAKEGRNNGWREERKIGTQKT
jgi:hypothetical protein